jgi:hypothetical protein
VRELANVLELLKRQGFDRCFDSRTGYLSLAGEQGTWNAEQARVVDVIGLDGGSDPGDDVTVFLLETDSGIRGYLLVPDSFHTDPDKAALVDALMAPRKPLDFQSQ